MRRSLLVSIAIAAATSFACPENELETTDAGTVAHDDASLPDAAEPPDAGEELSFVFESTDPQSPSFVFANPTVEDDRFTVDVFAHGLQEIQGIAFRVAYDPAVLTLSTFENLSVFARPPPGIERNSEVRPGLVLVALSHVGATNGAMIDGVAVARLTFARIAQVPTELRLARGFALDARGFEIKVRVGTGNLVER